MIRVDTPIGKRFGSLVILKEVDQRVDGCKQKRRIVTARCDCGAEREFHLFNVLYGRSTSCGCGRAHKTHGMSRTSTYLSWLAMVRRCTDINSSNYGRYGGAGISVCGRWKSFENFLDDMGERPANTSIDRVDNSRGYEPGNCRWATATTQARNQRRNRLLTHDGMTMPLAAWAEKNNLNAGTLRTRLRDGWTVERALMQPVRNTKDSFA